MHNDNYGWALAYPQVRLTTTRQSMPNQPTKPNHIANLSKLSDFLGTLPFMVGINSGFRTSEVNRAVGGESNSQHMNGLGADIYVLPNPLVPTVTNKDLATYFWHYREKMPELDQVIWYTNTGHVHIGICPKGGTGCPSGASPGAGRQQFRVKGSGYSSWVPSLADQTTLGARALIAMGPPRDWKKMAIIATGVTAGFILLAAGLALYLTRE